MNRREVLAASAAAAILPGQAMSASPTAPKPPVVKKVPKRIEQLGRVRIDDYAWMKDDNWQAVLRDPSLIKADVKAHLTEENTYTRAMLAGTVRLRMRERISTVHSAFVIAGQGEPGRTR
jgi:oligopeptidase B